MNNDISQTLSPNSSFLTDPARFCLRVVIGVVLAALISFLLHLDDPYWAVYPIAAAMSIYRGAAVSKAIEREFATILGGGIAYGLAALTVDHLAALCIAMLVFVALNVVFQLKSNRPYVFLLANVTGALILGSSAFLGDKTFNLLFWRVSTNTVGIVSLLFVSVLVFPKNAKKDMTLKIRYLFDAWRGLFSTIFNNVSQLDDSLVHLNKQINSAKSHFFDYSKDLGGSASKRDAAQQLFRLFDDLYQRLHNDENLLKKAFCNEDLKSKLPSFLTLWDSLLAGIDLLEKMLRKKAAHLEQLSLRDRLNACISEFETIRRIQYETHQYSVDEMKYFHLLMNTSQYLVGQFFNIESMVRIYVGLEKKKSTTPVKLFFIDVIDLVTVKQAIKVGVSFVASFLMWMLTNWPGGLQGLVSVCFLGTEKYFDDVLQKAKLRFMGCILGGGVGLSCLYLFQISIYNIFFLIVIFMGLFAYITIKSKKYSYLGFQANLAFAIAIIQPQYTPLVGPALERLSGIIIGIVGTLIVGLLLWPMFPRKVIAKLLPKITDQFSHAYRGVLFGWKANEESDVMTHLRKFIDEINECLKSRLQFHGETDAVYCQYKSRVNMLNQLFQILMIIRKNIDMDRVMKTADSLGIDLQRLSEVLCEHISEGLEHYVVQGKTVKAAYNIKISEYETIIHDELLKIRHSKKSLEIGREKISELNELLYKYDAVFALLTQRSVL